MKRFFFLSCVVFLVYSTPGVSQFYSKTELDLPGEITMQAVHTVTSDGGSAHLFSSASTAQQYLTLVKLSQAGSVQWMKRLHNSAPSFSDIVQAPDSGYYLSFCDYNGVGFYGVMRLDVAGNIIFSKRLTAPAPYEISTTPHIVVRADGGCYVTGDIVETNTLTFMEHVVRLDASGNVLWSNVYNMRPAKTYHRDVDTLSNGDLVILGACFDTLTSRYTPMLTRITAGGTMVWSKSYTNAGNELFAKSVVCMPGDRIVVSSQVYNLQFYSEMVLMRCDGQGNVLWTFTFSSPGDGINVTQSAEAENNTTVSVAITSSGSLFMKHDSSGLLLCERHYPLLELSTADTLPGSGYGLAGITAVSFRVVYITTDTCGNACEDSVFTVIKTPFTVTSTPLTGDMIMPLTDSVHVFSAPPPTVHVEPVCSGTIGVEEETPSETDVYPNPCTGTLCVRNTGDFETMQLLDVNGKIVMRRNITTATMEIDVSALEPGVYFLNLSSGSTRSTQKILITE